MIEMPLASGAFGHIKDTVLSALNREPTMDISPETVGTLSLIMLAQARRSSSSKLLQWQQTVIQAAHSLRPNKMKDAVIAKLANQAADFYGDAFKQCQYKDNLPKYFYFQEVLPVLAAKHCIMQANAELHQSILAKQKKRLGRRLLACSQKDNDFIYHDRVPEVKDLEHIGKAALVKATAITPPLSQKFTDLFEKMVPMAVQQSMSIYSQRKAETINRLVGSMREATNLCNGSSLKMLDDEETTDNELRTKFNQRWNRTPSGDLYKPLRAEGTNFRNILDKAVQADQVVRDRYSTHCDMIALLCNPRTSSTPPSPLPTRPKHCRAARSVVNVLRSQLAQLDEVKRERETLEGEIKAVTFDMSATFLTALAQDGPSTRSSCRSPSSTSCTEPTTRGYRPASAHRRSCWDKFRYADGHTHTHTPDIPSGVQQSEAVQHGDQPEEEVLKKLASAHDSYVEISSNLREGTKFYNDLTEILLKFQNKCSDIVFARKTERDELLKELQQSIAREPSAPSFNVPAYQSTPAPGPTPAPRTVFVSGSSQSQTLNTCESYKNADGYISIHLPSLSLSSLSSRNSLNKHSSSPRPSPSPQPGLLLPPSPSGSIHNSHQRTTHWPSNQQPTTCAPPTQAQGPPYPTYQGYPGYFQMPMGYNPYPYGQYNMPNMPYMPYQGPQDREDTQQQPSCRTALPWIPPATTTAAALLPSAILSSPSPHFLLTHVNTNKRKLPPAITLYLLQLPFFSSFVFFFLTISSCRNSSEWHL
ncbi:hypothetical protein INR49_023534 [Caranx melampygus]|nr:hypothetical protein INR49_023534 [Caranx melampygus]